MLMNKTEPKIVQLTTYTKILQNEEDISKFNNLRNLYTRGAISFFLTSSNFFLTSSNAYKTKQDFQHTRQLNKLETEINIFTN